MILRCVVGGITVQVDGDSDTRHDRHHKINVQQTQVNGRTVFDQTSQCAS
jgi:hypothetical protein